MKTFALFFLVFALTIAALAAGLFAHGKQSGMFPPGDNNPAVRSLQKQGVSWHAGEAPFAAKRATSERENTSSSPSS